VAFKRPFGYFIDQAARPFIGFVQVNVVKRDAYAQAINDLDRLILILFVNRFKTTKCIQFRQIIFGLSHRGVDNDSRLWRGRFRLEIPVELNSGQIDRVYGFRGCSQPSEQILGRQIFFT